MGTSIKGMKRRKERSQERCRQTCWLCKRKTRALLHRTRVTRKSAVFLVFLSGDKYHPILINVRPFFYCIKVYCNILGWVVCTFKGIYQLRKINLLIHHLVAKIFEKKLSSYGRWNMPSFLGTHFGIWTRTCPIFFETIRQGRFLHLASHYLT
jgi:hypothetical protein